jgi:transposase
MDFHLNSLLNLSQATVFTCYHETDFICLHLQLNNPSITCPNCQKHTDNLHDTSYILVRDLSIFGNLVYLKVPRRKFYCNSCGKYLQLGLKGLQNKTLLLKNNEDLNESERADLQGLFSNSTILEFADDFKEELKKIYESDLTVKSGLRKMQKWLSHAQIFFPSIANTLEKHLPDIANYFLTRTTSGVTEGINTRIKLILRQSYGFADFKSMREKLLACLFK